MINIKYFNPLFYCKEMSARLFLILISLQIFAPVFIHVNYIVNNSMYLKVCINKNRPEVKCKGKCKLSEQLASQSTENTENKTSVGKSVFEFESLLFSECENIFPLLHKSEKYYKFSESAVVGFKSGISWPPWI
ncbi:MAG: hypothetical protein MUE72_05205 [Chitinophagaceae bacterium]|nr:hypothetical protein [Chitinophagaceae bacterium]